MSTKATSLQHISRAFAGAPLTEDELGDFYVEASSARSSKARERLMRAIMDKIDEPQHILFVGHRGCGKSTELTKLKADLSKDFLVISLDVQTMLDIQDFNYVSLYIATIHRILAVVEEEQIAISSSYIARLNEWLNKEEYIKEITNSVGGDIATGAEFTPTIPWLGKVFVKLNAYAKRDVAFKKIVKREENNPFSQLIELCNALIRDILDTINQERERYIVCIYENLDKMPQISDAVNLFDIYAEQLLAIPVHTIFTYPIGLYYYYQFTRISTKYDKTVLLPMIKVLQKDGKTFNETGRDTLKRIVENRMELSLFESEEILTDAIALSGGSLRDLFLLIKAATDFARDDDSKKIRYADFRNAVQQLMTEYRQNLTDRRNDAGELVKASDYYAALVEVVNNPDKLPEDTELLMDLRQNLCVLTYNGEGWSDVHPIVKLVLHQRKMIDANLLYKNIFA